MLHERTVEILRDLPPYLGDEPTVQRTIDPVIRELQRIEAAANGFRTKLAPTLADDEYRTLELWEMMLGQPVKPAGATLIERRTKVLAYVRSRRAGTGASWIELLTLALGATPWSYFEGPDDYTVTIEVPYEEDSFTATQVLNLAREITPAHIDIIPTYGDGFLLGVGLLGIEPL